MHPKTDNSTKWTGFATLKLVGIESLAELVRHTISKISSVKPAVASLSVERS